MSIEFESLMDEVFGEENFIAQIIVSRRQVASHESRIYQA